MNDSPESPPELGEHPKGTLLVVGIFGLLFFAAWLVLWFVVFAGRGHLH